METMTAWTRQVPQVLDELEATGRYYVREEYVRRKNGEISDYYLELYRWYTERCRSLIHIAPGLTLPIWLSLTEDSRLPAAPNTVALTLEVPRDALVIVDADKWGYRVNDWYVPLDAADERRHNEELRRAGIGNEALLIMTGKGNFYPQFRQKIIRSWDRVFTSPSANMSNNIGTVWEIKSEWVREVERYG